MGRIVYPKKDPGYTVVRLKPTVNNGVLNNILATKNYGDKVNGSNRIGKLTGVTKTEAVDNYLYVWYEVMAVVQIAGRILERSGWIREDAFSFYYNNGEKQLDPKKQRLAYAEQQAQATQKAINATGLLMQELEKAVKGKTIPTAQRQVVSTLNNQYANTLTKLKGIKGVQLKGSNLSGLGIVPVIILVVVVAAVLVGFGISEWVKWSLNMKQVENEALTQQDLIKAQLSILNNPNATTGERNSASAELQKLNDASIDRSKELLENNKGNGFFSDIKSLLLLGIGGFIVIKLIK